MAEGASKDLNYLKDEEYDKLFINLEEVGRLLTKWIQSQRQYSNA